MFDGTRSDLNEEWRMYGVTTWVDSMGNRRSCGKFAVVRVSFACEAPAILYCGSWCSTAHLLGACARVPVLGVEQTASAVDCTAFISWNVAPLQVLLDNRKTAHANHDPRSWPVVSAFSSHTGILGGAPGRDRETSGVLRRAYQARFSGRDRHTLAEQEAALIRKRLEGATMHSGRIWKSLLLPSSETRRAVAAAEAVKVFGKWIQYDRAYRTAQENCV